MAQKTLSVTVELDRAEDPSVGTIAGRVLVPGNSGRHFVGWLELLAFLDEAITGMTQPPPLRRPVDLSTPEGEGEVPSG